MCTVHHLAIEVYQVMGQKKPSKGGRQSHLDHSSQQMPSSSTSQTTFLPHGRKLPIAQDATKSAVQRFFEAIEKDPALCCYGKEETLHALKFYIVDELLVSEEGLSGQLGMTYWEGLASEHKVARLHHVSASTATGRKFCRGFRVAGLLSRPLEPIEDLSPSSYSSPLLHTFNTGADILAMSENLLLPGVNPDETDSGAFKKIGLTTATDFDNSTSRCWAPSNARDAFFTWLERALRLEIPDNEMSVLALLDCVQVILAVRDQEEELGPMHDGLEHAVNVLAEEAPNCAAELHVRWCAAHFAESDYERIGVTEVQEVQHDMLSMPSICTPACSEDMQGLMASKCPSISDSYDLMTVAGILAMGTNKLVETRQMLQCSEVLARAATYPSWV